MKTLTAFLVLLTLTVLTHAHRLDEYLQATRIGILKDRIEVRIDLTPGVAVLPEVLPLIDPDRDGRVAPKEQKAYSQRLLREVHLELDRRLCPLKVARMSFPPRALLLEGEGVIHITAVSKFHHLAPGAHALFYRNDHLPKISVYLVNALAPETKQVVITRQSRDELQREYRLDFQVR